MRGIVRKTDKTMCQIETPTGVLDEVEFVQNYGFASIPDDGTEAILGNDDSDNVLIVVCENRKYRVKLEKKEVAIYHQNGDKIHFKNDNTIEIETKKLVIKADEIKTKGNSVEVKADSVKVCEATEPAVLGEKLASLLNTLLTLLTTPAGVTTGPGSPIGPNPAWAAQLSAMQGQLVGIKSQKIKVS